MAQIPDKVTVKLPADAQDRKPVTYEYVYQAEGRIVCQKRVRYSELRQLTDGLRQKHLPLPAYHFPPKLLSTPCLEQHTRDALVKRAAGLECYLQAMTQIPETWQNHEVRLKLRSGSAKGPTSPPRRPDPALLFMNSPPTPPEPVRTPITDTQATPQSPPRADHLAEPASAPESTVALPAPAATTPPVPATSPPELTTPAKLGDSAAAAELEAVQVEQERTSVQPSAVSEVSPSRVARQITSEDLQRVASRGTFSPDTSVSPPRTRGERAKEGGDMGDRLQGRVPPPPSDEQVVPPAPAAPVVNVTPDKASPLARAASGRFEGIREIFSPSRRASKAEDSPDGGEGTPKTPILRKFRDLLPGSTSRQNSAQLDEPPAEHQEDSAKRTEASSVAPQENGDVAQAEAAGVGGGSRRLSASNGGRGRKGSVSNKKKNKRR